MDRSDIGRVLEDEGLNAVLAWLLVGVVCLSAGVNLLAGERLWAGFALALAALAVVPPVITQSTRTMLPWEVLLLASVPLLARPFGGAGTGSVATYLSVAAVALVIAVELHLFTPVEMNRTFAVVFVVVTTMATAGVWAVVRWVADIYLGTGFDLDERALMLEFVASTAAGVGAGVVFEYYFRRIARVEERLDLLPEAKP